MMLLGILDEPDRGASCHTWIIVAWNSRQSYQQSSLSLQVLSLGKELTIPILCCLRFLTRTCTPGRPLRKLGRDLLQVHHGGV